MATAGGSKIVANAEGVEIQPNGEGVLWESFQDEIGVLWDTHDLEALGNWGRTLRGWINDGHPDGNILALCYEYVRGAYDLTRIGITNLWWDMTEQVCDMVQDAYDEGVPMDRIERAVSIYEREVQKIVDRQQILA